MAVRFAVTDTAGVDTVLLEADFGDGYAPYPSEPGCEACRVDLPAGRRGSQVALRLTVEDTAGNRLRYEARPAYVVPPIRSYLPLLAATDNGPVWFTELLGDRVTLLDPAQAAGETVSLSSGTEIEVTHEVQTVTGETTQVQSMVTEASPRTTVVPTHEEGGFVEHVLPDPGSMPAGIALQGESVWFAESGTGRIAHLVPEP